MSANIRKFLALRTALVNEQARIQARLREIAQVLGESAPVPAAAAPAPTKGRRKFSEATKAKMRLAQQARWAKKKGNAPQSSAAAPMKKRKMTAAGRAAIAAAAKARWAKAKAAGKATLAG